MTAARSFTDLTSAEAGAQVRGATLVWPIGTIEQHGPHLPLSVDIDIPQALARAVAARLGGYLVPVHSIAARSLPQSGGGLSFPGTVYVRGAVLVEYLRDAVASLMDLRPGRLVVINGHYENEALIYEALDLCRTAGALGSAEVFAFSWWSLVHETWLSEHVPKFPGWHAEHAGFTETSLMLHLRPELVTPVRPVHDTPPHPGVYLHPADHRQLSHQGALSSSELASAEAGESLFGHVVHNICELVRVGHGVLR
ncbi:creatininase family protein [Dactylosporangium roseum]|uniref:Creatininase family protein n=1 Tax=Dactylosporangium roseum TaxID=47989 RepID=A0ABY5Z2F7_9ACTN|nr:creatininase family protein [Dactylosporangium roseum]UWZ36204.1 creatininase family protein [Dactylosporangium roseum]